MSQDTGANRTVSPAIAGATTNKDRTLLIADDDAAFRNRIARALELRGFIVTSVGSVAEATEVTMNPRSSSARAMRLRNAASSSAISKVRSLFVVTPAMAGDTGRLAPVSWLMASPSASAAM